MKLGCVLRAGDHQSPKGGIRVFKKSFAQTDTDTERRFLPSACIRQIFGVRTFFGKRTLTRPRPTCRQQATLDMQLYCTVLIAVVRALSLAA